MVARTVEEISSLAGVQVEEDTRYDDDFFFKAGLEEVQAVADCFGKAFEVKPEVESAIWDGFDHESHFAEALDDIVSLGLKNDGLGIEMRMGLLVIRTMK